MRQYNVFRYPTADGQVVVGMEPEGQVFRAQFLTIRLVGEFRWPVYRLIKAVRRDYAGSYNGVQKVTVRWITK